MPIAGLGLIQPAFAMRGNGQVVSRLQVHDR